MLICMLMFYVTAYSQQESRNWYFGSGTDGLVFNGGVPVKVSNKFPGAGFEGMIVVSDPATGDLLFYSDGIRVINRNHAIMQNGTGLTGNFSGAQCVQCCPVPGSCPRQYYLFTNSAYDQSQGDIKYSIIDFSTDPLGTVIQKNTPVWNGPSDEGMCLVNKPGTSDYWLIANTYNTGMYNVFSITSAGISAPSVYNFSITGSSYQMNYSEAAKKIVVTGYGNKRVLTINFDAATGVLSNEVALNSPWNGNCYGARFSPDGTKLYVSISSGVNLVQYDYTNGVWTKMNTCCIAHDLKMGPDNKMYHIRDYTATQPISVIDYPNLSAVGNVCSYRTLTFIPAFNGEVRRFPEFVTLPKPSIANMDVFTLSDSMTEVLDVMQNDVSPTGTPFVIDAIISPPLHGTAVIGATKIFYTRKGCVKRDTFIYRIRDNNCSFDTAIVIIEGKDMKAPALTVSPVVCIGDTIRLTTPTLVGGTYYWTGPSGFTSNAQNPVIAPAQASNQGTYRLSVAVGNCTSDTAHVIVSIISGMPLTAGPDQQVCEGSTVALSGVSMAGVLYRWTGPDGFVATGPGPEIKNIKVSQSGAYRVIAFVQGCTSAPETTMVHVNPKPAINPGADMNVCEGNKLSLSVQHFAGGIYHWNGPNGFSAALPDVVIDPVSVQHDGVYEVWVELNGCKSDTEQIDIGVAVSPVVDLGVDRKVCSNELIALDAGNAGSSFLWDDLSASQVRHVKAPGTFIVSVKNAGGCTTNDTVVLDTFPAPQVFIGNDTNFCSGSTVILSPQTGTYTSYVWQDQSTGNTLTITSAGVYWLAVKDQNNCEARDTISLKNIITQKIDMPSLIRICDSDTLIGPKRKFRSYVWHDGSTQPSFLVTDYGTYTLETVDSNFCPDFVSVEVVSNCAGVIYMPNAFSPNRDGINDLCYPVVKHLRSLHFVIYNRWGQRVFDTHTFNHGWDGTIKGTDAQSDTYSYSIEAVDMQQKTHRLHGNVTLLR